MNYKMVDFPQYIPIDIYGTYIDKYVQAVKQFSGVKAVYQMGSTSTPGISDIDLIVVVDRKFNPYEYQKLSVKNVFRDDPTANYLFIHDVAVIDNNSFEDIHYINYWDNLKLLYGEEMSIKEVGEETKKVLGFAISVDFLISRLHQFEYLIKSNIFPVRGNIVRASSLKHTAKLITELGLSFEKDILDKTQELRGTWFENEDKNNAIEYFHDSIDFFNNALLSFNKYFEDEILVYNEKNHDKKLKILSELEKVTIFTNSKSIDGINNDDKNMYYRFLQKLGQNSTIILYPDNLFFHYLTYSRFKDNYVSEKINYLLTNGNIIFEVEDFYEEVMRKRCEAISKSIKFIKENRIYFSNSNGYPGFNMLL